MTDVGFIVVSDDGLAVFSSIHVAEQYLEAQDVEDGVYPVAFDPQGRVYRLEASDIGTWQSGKVEAKRTGEVDADRLRELIIRTIRKARINIDESTSLVDLVRDIRYMIEY
jgi:hypothetical protein